MIGRRKPYTSVGVRRVRCTRCGLRASQQWQACANGGRWVPICAECDIELNRIALTFMRIPGAAALITKYAAAVRGT